MWIYRIKEDIDSKDDIPCQHTQVRITFCWLKTIDWYIVETICIQRYKPLRGHMKFVRRSCGLPFRGRAHVPSWSFRERDVPRQRCSLMVVNLMLTVPCLFDTVNVVYRESVVFFIVTWLYHSVNVLYCIVTVMWTWCTVCKRFFIVTWLYHTVNLSCCIVLSWSLGEREVQPWCSLTSLAYDLSNIIISRYWCVLMNQPSCSTKSVPTARWSTSSLLPTPMSYACGEGLVALKTALDANSLYICT